ncbi:hypothetical protein DY000_02041539 [Brassica cretica]|uniref:DC1 domain-containing protein n=1 Tax=Brassica cretica TaxID=69181 RepID=A0ABQ7B9Z4_BRACR|nr:hypothetical protein DY000_02041539 [Brassica cretica]
MYSPHTIKISRHHHRISHVSSLRYGKCPCGVCRQSIDGDYGAYTCNKCGDYAVHSRCALGKDVWDGEELEGIPEKDEDDITQDAPPFSKISKGLIHYFLHDHHLRLEENILYDEKKLREACVMPIFEEKLYSCTECDFILHETCLKARRRIQHALHPHLLILKTINNVSGDFRCDACWCSCGGFVYQCPKEEWNVPPYHTKQGIRATNIFSHFHGEKRCVRNIGAKSAKIESTHSSIGVMIAAPSFTLPAYSAKIYI